MQKIAATTTIGVPQGGTQVRWKEEAHAGIQWDIRFDAEHVTRSSFNARS